MNRNHQELVVLLKRHSGQGTKHQAEREKNYIGSEKYSYTIKSSVKRQFIKEWLKHHLLTFSEYFELLNSLYRGKSHDEISIGGKLLEYLPKLRKQLNPESLNKWLDDTEGWSEVDSLCQSNFTAEEMLSNWTVWKKLMDGLSVSKNIHKRRASLVLLTGPVRKSPDTKLSNLAFENIAKLQEEREILITKAISWLLRDLIKYHRKEVETFLEKNSLKLPKIAVRETVRKLTTGKK